MAAIDAPKKSSQAKNENKALPEMTAAEKEAAQNLTGKEADTDSTPLGTGKVQAKDPDTQEPYTIDHEAAKTALKAEKGRIYSEGRQTYFPCRCGYFLHARTTVCPVCGKVKERKASEQANGTSVARIKKENAPVLTEEQLMDKLEGQINDARDFIEQKMFTEVEDALACFLMVKRFVEKCDGKFDVAEKRLRRAGKLPEAAPQPVDQADDETDETDPADTV